ncbi:unnamed protein product [Adineta ricciae]|uniref:Uncharacterized protein n=1 Tax=Adineta ricciae TaxID=249248 RepID=A0A814M3Y5_ADIRI|nr:unnamed protein product [Adineta ricciae]CAF1190308.1 unnamed protein product [Adineta ricciae]
MEDADAVSDVSRLSIDANIRLLPKSTEKLVGFAVRNKAAIGLIFFCGICSLLLRDPVQLTCSHRFCKSCVEPVDGETIRCTHCHTEVPKETVFSDKGFKNDMSGLEIECYHCDWQGIYKDYETHLEENHSDILCESCGERFTSANSLVLHEQNDCEKTIVACPLKEFGCSDRVERAHIHDHYLTQQHQNAILAAARQLKAKLAPNQISDDMEMETYVHDGTAHSTTTTNNAMSQLPELNEVVGVLVDGVQVLVEHTRDLSMESVRIENQVENLHEELETLKVSVPEQSIFLSGLKPNQEILAQEVASLKQHIDEFQYTSYDGSLIWKITDVSKKISDAQGERQTSIYSPIFYSSPNGYKIRARLYPYGDGNARRTHLSVFFVLMRGRFDHLLAFPFQHKVIFCLYDQTPTQRHLIDCFRPDVKSNSFQRPRSEMNIASGIPKFCPLAIIQQENNPYVRNDTMFIKIMIDFEELPKRVLPYALSLDPGLPAHIRQRLIRQETERQAQQNNNTT